MTVRAFTPSDAAGVASLFGEVFGRATTEEKVRWKLLEAPAAPGAPTAFVAEHGGRLVGHYGGTPVRFQVHGAARTAISACDAMTAPDFRRRGILTALVTAAHDAWRRAGVAFVVGLPNEAWGSRTAALGWAELFPIRWLVSLLRPEAALARRLGIPALARLSPVGAAWRLVSALRSPRDRSIIVTPLSDAAVLDTLWASCRDEHELTVVRDGAWVTWRYLRCPEPSYRVLLATREGRPAGYVALSRKAGARHVGVVAELFTRLGDAPARAQLLRAACRIFEVEGLEAVSSLAVEGSPSWRSLRAAGFRQRRAFGVEAVALDPAMSLEALSDPHRWSLAGGDFDAV